MNGNPLWHPTRRFAPVLAGLLTLAMATAGSAPPADQGIAFGDPVEGQSLFASKGCVDCHAVRGAGGHVGPDLGRKVFRNSYYEIAAVMWNHAVGMQGKMDEYRLVRPTFEDEELSDLISFLYFLNYFDEPGDPRAGRTLFTEKHCIRCHRVGDEGGDTGPPLDQIPRGISPLAIARSLWNHGPTMVSAITEAGLEVPQFADTEIIDLFAYVRSQGQRQGARRFLSPGDPERGRQVFEDKGCAACHEVFGAEESVGPDLGRMELRGSVTQIAGRMWNHWPAMSRTMANIGMEVPEFDEDELGDLFAYLYIERYTGRPGDSEAGRKVYADKGCSVCHGAAGEGGVGPDLKERTVGRSPSANMQAMWNHAPQMSGLLQAQDQSWVQLTEREVADLLSFLSVGWGSAGEDG